MNILRLTTPVLMLSLLASAPVWAAEGLPMDPKVAYQKAQNAIAQKDYATALQLLTLAVPDSHKLTEPDGPKCLLKLGEAAEGYVGGINQKWRKRRVLDPKASEWVPFVRKRQRWAEKHFATFEYYEVTGRYRYTGDAYRIFLRNFPKHPMAQEAAWRLLACDEIGPNDWGSNGSLPLADARRYETYLKRFPKSAHRLAAKVAIGWDYLYASGIMWGKPEDRHAYDRGITNLQEVVRLAPASKEAQQARILLERHAQKRGH